MDNNKYEKLIAILMEKLEQTEIEKNWLGHQNSRLEERVQNLIDRLEGKDE